MIQVNIDESELKSIYIKMVEERLAVLESETFFLNSKQLQKFVGMSWNSITDNLMSDPNFPAIRLGHKWLFPRYEVERYLKKFFEEVRDSGGEITKFRKR